MLLYIRDRVAQGSALDHAPEPCCPVLVHRGCPTTVGAPRTPRAIVPLYGPSLRQSVRPTRRAARMSRIRRHQWFIRLLIIFPLRYVRRIGGCAPLHLPRQTQIPTPATFAPASLLGKAWLQLEVTVARVTSPAPICKGITNRMFFICQAQARGERLAIRPESNSTTDGDACLRIVHLKRTVLLRSRESSLGCHGLLDSLLHPKR